MGANEKENSKKKKRRKKPNTKNDTFLNEVQFLRLVVEFLTSRNIKLKQGKKRNKPLLPTGVYCTGTRVLETGKEWATVIAMPWDAQVQQYRHYHV